MANLLSIPPDVIIYILHGLQIKDLLACQVVNFFLNHIIQDSALLQYKLTLSRAYAEDSPLSNKRLSDKVNALKRIEGAWLAMRSDFSCKIWVPEYHSGIYDLSGGAFILSKRDCFSLGYMRLPTVENEETLWTILKVGSRRSIIDVGLSVLENDLMAIACSSGAGATYQIELDLIELSTKNPHPLAQQKTIQVMLSPISRPSVAIEIVGKHLVFVISFISAPSHPLDRVFIYNWQTGAIVARFEARSVTYYSVVFLDERHILLPNKRRQTLDVYLIPESPTPSWLQPILKLALPQVASDRVLLTFAAGRAEPNPISPESLPAMRARAEKTPDLRSIDLRPTGGYALKAATALCLFQLHYHIFDIESNTSDGPYSFTFVAPRNELLKLVEQHAKNPLGQPVLIINPEDQDPNPQSAIDGVTPVIPYALWGPKITAWFGGNEKDISSLWMNTSAGRRCVRMPVGDDTTHHGHRFFVCDFGQLNVHDGHVYGAAKSVSDDAAIVGNDEPWVADPLPGHGQHTLLVRGGRVLNCPPLFRDPVAHHLPYVMRKSRAKYRWQAILLDEERVIGFNLTAEQHVSSMQVVHFG